MTSLTSWCKPTRAHLVVWQYFAGVLITAAILGFRLFGGAALEWWVGTTNREKTDRDEDWRE
jgi:hypothetical protein